MSSRRSRRSRLRRRGRRCCRVEGQQRFAAGNQLRRGGGRARIRRAARLPAAASADRRSRRRTRPFSTAGKVFRPPVLRASVRKRAMARAKASPPPASRRSILGKVSRTVPSPSSAESARPAGLPARRVRLRRSSPGRRAAFGARPRTPTRAGLPADRRAAGFPPAQDAHSAGIDPQCDLRRSAGLRAAGRQRSVVRQRVRWRRGRSAPSSRPPRPRRSSVRRRAGCPRSATGR